jgi:hypothetical protein
MKSLLEMFPPEGPTDRTPLLAFTSGPEVGVAFPQHKDEHGHILSVVVAETDLDADPIEWCDLVQRYHPTDAAIRIIKKFGGFQVHRVDFRDFKTMVELSNPAVTPEA